MLANPVVSLAGLPTILEVFCHKKINFFPESQFAPYERSLQVNATVCNAFHYLLPYMFMQLHSLKHSDTHLSWPFSSALHTPYESEIVSVFGAGDSAKGR